MNIFKYKKYVIGLLIAFCVFLIVLSITDGIERKSRQITFPGGFLKEDMGIALKGKYAGTEIFTRGLVFENDYSVVLPNNTTVSENFFIGSCDDIPVCVVELKDVASLEDDTVMEYFKKAIPNKINHSINDAEMSVYRDEKGFIGNYYARYICGARTNKISTRSQDEYGFMLALFLGDDIVCYYTVTTEYERVEDAVWLLRDLAATTSYYGSSMYDFGEGTEEDYPEGYIGNDSNDDGLGDEYEVEQWYNDEVDTNVGSSATVTYSIVEGVTSGIVGVSWSNYSSDVNITVYDQTYGNEIPLDEISIDGLYAKFHFDNAGGSVFEVKINSNQDLGYVDVERLN